MRPVAGTWQRVVTVLCAVAMIVPAVGASAHEADSGQKAQTQSDLESVERRLGEARENLDEVAGQKKATVADLEKIDVRRAQLDGQLAAVTAELAAAQQRLNETAQRLADTEAELGEAELRLRRTRRDLQQHRARFHDRVRASYKNGGANYATAVFDVRDIAELTRTYKYVQAVMDNDREQVTLVAGLERDAQAQTEQLAALREEREQQQDLAQAERDRVAEIVAEQTAVQREVAAEAERHRLVLAELQSEEASYTALVGSLEAESAKLEAELRRIAEEERRRREAAGRTGRADEAPGQLARPSNGPITSRYGYRSHPIFGGERFHAGIDFGAPTGAPVFAAEDGVVVSAGWRGGYGNAIVVDHGGGMATLYAHLSALGVSSGQRVARGQTIGAVGSTGYSTGPHLHFEVRIDGQPRDPMNYL